MNPEDFNYFQSRVSRFISGKSSGKNFLSGAPVAKITRLSGILPKRRIPEEVLSKSSKVSDDGIETSGGSISALGRITLDLEIINNNLDKIASIILQDYKDAKETNRKEVEEYRKRISNRGRIFGKKELGDRKTDLLGGIKKFVGSFFSGTGGSIRALAMFNLLQGLMTGDPSKIIGPLLGIGLTYVPAIVGSIVSGVAGGLSTKLFSKNAVQAAEGAAPMVAKTPKLAKLGKFGKNAALAGVFATMAAALLNKDQDPQKQRLEQLTEQQKGSVDPENLQPIPQDDLKKFEQLNKRFEAALDFLMGKGGGQQQQQPTPPGGGPGGPGGNPNLVGGPGLEGLSAFIAGAETHGRFDAFNNDGGTGDPTLLQTNVSDLRSYMDRKHPNSSGAVGAYQFMPETAEGYLRQMGLDPSRTKFSPDIQKQLNMYHLNKLGYSDYVSGKMSKEEFGKNIAQQYRAVPDPRTGYTYADSAASRNAAQVTNAQFLQALEASKTGASLAPVLPSAAPTPAAAPAAPRNLPPVGSGAPRVRIITVPTGPESSQASQAVGTNDVVPGIDTTYPENFLALYSKLIYQIV